VTRWLILTFGVLLMATLALRADDSSKKTADEKPARGDELKPLKPKKPAQPDGETEEAKILERLTKNTKTAEKKLADSDTGEETRKLMREILKDIDELLKKAQHPPQDQQNDQSSSSSSSSSSDSSQPKPSQGSSAQQKPSSGSSSQQQKSNSLSRREQREQRRQQEAKKGGGTSSAQNAPKPMGKPDKPGDKDPLANGTGTGGVNVKNPMGGKPDGKAHTDLDPKLAEMYKDVWGHLPEKMRQEMDSYFKERFMPRYNDLLKQYYSTIAEQNKKK
jgi:hypothetical protein